PRLHERGDTIGGYRGQGRPAVGRHGKMSNLSTIAETIADYAISIAKRNENEVAGELHLLAAIRRWQTERFDSQFPQALDPLSAALAKARGQSIRVSGLDEAAARHLSSVSSASDVWELADSLVNALPGLAPNDGQGSPGGGDPSGGESSAGAPEHTFAITEPLLQRVTALLDGDLAEVTHLVLSDAHAVATRVLGGLMPTLSALMLGDSGLAAASLDANSELSLLVARLAKIDKPEAGKVATQVAMAFVEVAQWAAGLDQRVTEEETDRIDDIRLELRRQLADRLDAESPAIAEFERKFAHLVGMQAVKAELRKRVDYLVVSKRRERQGHKDGSHRMHLAFVGNPGTGKTTVARLYGELLNDLGLLPTAKFVETDRSGLVAEYVGQTEPKTLKVIDSAEGGVLFIDEAYALEDDYGNGQKGFGEEATDVLVKQMEDRRDRLVVVIAGYREPTLSFMEVNPGLKSRIPLVVDFPDYSRDELAEICRRIAAAANLTLHDAAVEKMASLLDNDRNAEGFGNARAAENLLEAAHRNVVSRTASLGNLATEDEVSTILPGDVPDAISAGAASVQRPICFR
ncbi:MAG: AAA family ATPase, partial [Planctomycetaceae bacterium]